MPDTASNDSIAPSSGEEGVGGGGDLRDILRARATVMRNNPTEPENRLWQALKGKQLQHWKFRRQQVIGQRIVDFYCPSAKLAVEVDGETHNPETDQARDARLFRERCVRVIRFANEDVMRNLDGVLMQLLEALHASNHPPTPSFSKEGEV
ncbi:MAG: endonuclease domain-containing protein [Pseudomonadota bacterium]